MKLLVSDLGRIDYEEGVEIQKSLLKLKKEDKIDDILLLLEHSPVLTIGKSGEDSNVIVPEKVLEKEGIKVHKVGRGGDVTYHGPGQIVGYPILDLRNHGKSIKKFVHNIEKVFIELLKEEYGIKAGQDPEYIGVWVEDEKITAIGFAVKRWITMHGFAFNVNTNLDHFKLINPCGITDRGVTSLEKILGSKQDIDEVKKQVVKYFCKVFNMEHKIIDKDVLYKTIGGEANEE